MWHRNTRAQKLRLAPEEHKAHSACQARENIEHQVCEAQEHVGSKAHEAQKHSEHKARETWDTWSTGLRRILRALSF